MGFIREASANTPFVKIDYDKGFFELVGRSSPEHTIEFYDPIFKAIAQFNEKQVEDIEANFKLLYFNTSSARCIFMATKEFKKLQEAGKKITINWHIDEDDEDMEETGKDFMDLIDMPFNFIENPEE